MHINLWECFDLEHLFYWFILLFLFQEAMFTLSLFNGALHNEAVEEKGVCMMGDSVASTLKKAQGSCDMGHVLFFIAT